MHIHLDPLGGIAGDMFIAAVLDAWPEWEADFLAALEVCGLPAGWTPQIGRQHRQSIAGLHFALKRPDHTAGRHMRATHVHEGAGYLHAHHHHNHQPQPHAVDDSGAYREIRARLTRSALDPDVKAHALAIFDVLAEAEAAVHGIAVDEVHFHELADWDSIADIVGAAWLVARIGAASWSVGPLPLGGGIVRTAHGALPVPAPATARLLQGFDMIDDGIGGERVTPTGAAILRHLAPTKRAGVTGRMVRSGHGLGTRELPDRANLLRLVALETSAASAAGADQVAVVTFDIDDQTAEDLALALDHLRELPGVFDVTACAVYGKKGRLAQRVQILCAPASVDAVRSRSFIETTTIGLRWRLEQRSVLPRSQLNVGGMRVKRVLRPDGRTTAKAEIEDARELASHAARGERRGGAEAAAVRDDEA